MAREDYDEIKEKFHKFIAIWKSRNVEDLDEMIDPAVICYISTVKAYACGSQHAKAGVRDFILDMPERNVFHFRVCNYVCRIAGENAHQIGQAVCVAARYGQDENSVSTFEFTAMLSVHWIKKECGWMINELRIDILDNGGDLEEYREAFYFEEPRPRTYPGVHYPCICGELDSPWHRIPNAENIYTEEEKIGECFARYAFAIDNLAFAELERAVAEDAIANIAPWISMDKRSWISSLKYHRQRERQWAHPGKISQISINGEEAEVEIYRMAGHRQRIHPYVYTKENIHREHACAFYKIKCKKEDGKWKIKLCNYYLGIVELGSWEDANDTTPVL